MARPDGQRRRADDEVVHADLRLLDLIELLPKRKKIRDVVVDGQIEVRDRPGRLREALGDGATHRGERDGFLLECLLWSGGL